MPQTSFASIQAGKGYFERLPEADAYLLRGKASQAWFEADSIWLSLSRARSTGRETTLPDRVNLRLSFVESNSSMRLLSEGPLNTRINYFIGDNAIGWGTDQPAWSVLRYQDLYPGIDLVVEPGAMLQDEGMNWQLELASWADPSVVKMQVEGAKHVQFLKDAIILETEIGEVRLPLIRINRETNPSIQVMGRLGNVRRLGEQVFLLEGLLGSTDQLNPRQQDEDQGDLVFSTFLGGSDLENGNALAIDGEGYIYITGRTRSVDFPTTTGAVDTRLSQFDVFVAKLTPDGSGLEYATYLGGSGQDTAWDIALDGGNLYISGETWSGDFPGAGNLAGASDAFVSILNQSGNLLRKTTLIGGSEQDTGYGLAVQEGFAYICGITYSEDFPAQGYQRNGDAFVAYLNANGDLVRASLLSGGDVDAAFELAVNDEAIYVTGETSSVNFILGDYMGGREAFLVKLNPEGERLEERLIGGSGDEAGTSLILDDQGNVYLTGWTTSADFPNNQGVFGGEQDAFLAQIDADGQLSLLTTIGGSSVDEGRGVGLDPEGQILIVGNTNSLDFPLTQSPLQEELRGAGDVFIARLDPNELGDSPLTYATYLGGESIDQASDLVLDGLGDVIITGYTRSADYPSSQGALSTRLGGQQDAFLSKISLGTPQEPLPTRQVTITATATPLPIAQFSTVTYPAAQRTPTTANDSENTPQTTPTSASELTALVATLKATGLLPTDTGSPATATIIDAIETPVPNSEITTQRTLPSTTSQLTDEPPLIQDVTPSIDSTSPSPKPGGSQPETGPGRLNVWWIFVPLILLVASFYFFRQWQKRKSTKGRRA